jgi:hypothetical protein
MVGKLIGSFCSFFQLSIFHTNSPREKRIVKKTKMQEKRAIFFIQKGE